MLNNKGKGWTLKSCSAGKPKHLYVWIYDASATASKRFEMEAAGFKKREVFSISRQVSVGRVDKLAGDGEKIYESIKAKIIKNRIETDSDKAHNLAARKARRILEDWSEIEFEAMKGV
jgi:hypothetical protein